jgi:hypothetical protein
LAPVVEEASVAALVPAQVPVHARRRARARVPVQALVLVLPHAARSRIAINVECFINPSLAPHRDRVDPAPAFIS